MWKWAKSNSEIRNKLSGKIKKITFFTPNFNDSKPDASNYSCAIVELVNSSDKWVVIYRPSYVREIDNDVIVKNVSLPLHSFTETKLNSEFPISAIAPEKGGLLFCNDCFQWRHLPSDTKYNPDKYILPLDIIYRSINRNFDHYAIYLGNGWVAHLLDDKEGFKFDSWSKFQPSNGGSSSFSSSSSSSSSSNSDSSVCLYRPKIPFKRKGDIIRHIAKAVSYSYGRYSYDARTNNCEHITRRCVLSINSSWQADSTYSIIPPMPWEFSSFVKNSLPVSDMILPLEIKMMIESSELDRLTSNYSYEKNRIEEYMKEAESNRSYTQSKYQIEQEKFQEQIEICPKDWCQIS